MKVVLLIQSLVQGGSERQLVTLAAELSQRGVDVTVITFYSKGVLRRILDEKRIPVVSLQKSGRWDLVGFSLRYIRTIRAIRPEVLYSFLPVSNIMASLAGIFMPGLTVVWGIRSGYLDMENYDGLTRLTYWVEKLLARRSDLIIANSHLGRDVCIKKGFPEKQVIVVANGIDTDMFRSDVRGAAAFRRQWGASKSTIVIGLPSRYDPMKDHKTFFSAASILRKKNSDLLFVCVGWGDDAYMKELKSFAEQKGLDECLVWAGEIEDMRAAYSAFDVSVSSSYGEGFPNCIAEAMACETPCVVTDVGDSALIASRYGRVVPPRDPSALAQAIERMLEETDEERTQLGVAGRHHIVNRFSNARLAEETITFIEHLRNRGV